MRIGRIGWLDEGQDGVHKVGYPLPRMGPTAILPMSLESIVFPRMPWGPLSGSGFPALSTNSFDMRGLISRVGSLSPAPPSLLVEPSSSSSTSAVVHASVNSRLGGQVGSGE